MGCRGSAAAWRGRCGQAGSAGGCVAGVRRALCHGPVASCCSERGSFLGKLLCKEPLAEREPGLPSAMLPVSLPEKLEESSEPASWTSGVTLANRSNPSSVETRLP